MTTEATTASTPRRDGGSSRRDAMAEASGSRSSDAASEPSPEAAITSDAAAPGATCEAPRSECGGRCVDTQRDSEHCGGCGESCGARERCEQGTCRAAEACADSCAFAGGIDWACKLRFMYGLNYAWHHFGADFGGNTKWNQPGVSNNDKVTSELESLSTNGVSVLRWWLFPDFRGDGVKFDGAEMPSGLGGTFTADLERALQLAEDYDMYLMLTLFSFDNFRPTKMDAGVLARSIRPIVLDPAKRKALLEKVVRPIARAASASPHAKRLIAWDVINEPEWAIRGASAYGGDPDFDPNPELEAIEHGEMETFLREVITVLREESEALITVGATAIKWKSAWSKLDLDIHQFHIYDWVNMYWPYHRSPADYGLDDKPLVMGEFPMRGLRDVGYGTLLDSWYENGYAGALGWAYTDAMFGGPDVLPEVKRFADRHACETRY